MYIDKNEWPFLELNFKRLFLASMLCEFFNTFLRLSKYYPRYQRTPMWVDTFEVYFVLHKTPFIWLPVFLSLWQLTMEKLCRLRPLHSGLTPAVLKDLQWADVSQSSFCQCWMTTLTQLKPAQRALLYSALQEVMMTVLAGCVDHQCFVVISDSRNFNNWAILITTFLFVYEYLPYVYIAVTSRDLQGINFITYRIKMFDM